MKEFLIAALALSAGTLLAVDAARVDITANDGMAFEKTGKNGTAVSGAGWLKAQGKSGFTTNRNVTDEWSGMEFSFTPDKDGTVVIELRGQWAKNIGERNFVVFDNVVVEGVELSNGGFEEKTADGRPAGWSMGRDGKAGIVRDAKTGEGAVKVNHDNAVGRSIRVEGGKTYVFRADVKKAEAE